MEIIESNGSGYVWENIDQLYEEDNPLQNTQLIHKDWTAPGTKFKEPDQ